MGISTIEKPWTVSIKDTNHKRLLKIKKEGEKMNDVVGRLLDVFEKYSEQESASSNCQA